MELIINELWINKNKTAMAIVINFEKHRLKDH